MNLIFSGAGIITGLFYIFIILFSKKYISKYFLVAFIVFLSLPLLPVLLNEFQVRRVKWLNPSVTLLWGPLLYFYISSLIKKKIKIYSFLLHAIPFIIFYVIAIMFPSILPAPPNKEMLPPLSGNLQPKANYQWVFKTIQNCSLFGYSTITIFLLNKYRKVIKNNYSYVNLFLTIRWSYFIVILFLSVYLLFATIHILFPTLALKISLDLNNILIVLFIYLLGFFGIQQKPVYRILDQDSRYPATNKLNNEPQKEKYSRNKLSEALKEDYTQKLLNYIESEKPYLKPKLSINDLSEAIGVPKHFISQIINDSLGQTFYSFINSYRVSEVKARIENDQEEKYTLLAIAFDSGFNSKSGFNKNFKLETGMTPQEYKSKVRLK